MPERFLLFLLVLEGQRHPTAAGLRLDVGLTIGEPLPCELLGRRSVGCDGLHEIRHLLDRPVERPALDRHAVLGEQKNGSLLANTSAKQEPERSRPRPCARIDAKRVDQPVELVLDDIERLPKPRCVRRSWAAPRARARHRPRVRHSARSARLRGGGRVVSAGSRSSDGTRARYEPTRTSVCPQRRSMHLGSCVRGSADDAHQAALAQHR